MNPTFAIYDAIRIEELRRELRLQPQLIRRMWTAFCKKSLGVERALQELPEEARTHFSRRVQFHSLRLEQRHDSQLDGATKLLFRTADGMLIESVILRTSTGRTSLCLSSQVGCAANCDFCATGKMGIARNLSAADMLDQIVQANELLRDEGRSVRNLVFMGMGEPFHNEEALYETIQALVAPEYFHHPPRRILVSTVGIPDAMLRCARRFPSVNLALSLHSPNQEVREKLIPLAKKYPLEELRRTVKQLNEIQPSTVMIEYLLLEGVNDSAADASELIDFLRDLRVHVNLIPYNPIDEAPHLGGTDRAGREAFGKKLKEAGLPTTIRYSLGADIAAACGQLVRKENRRANSRLLDVPDRPVPLH